MSNVRTVSDTKRLFYTVHTRPVASIYRRVVEELMVEMHLLSVNVDFKYDSIYALGVVTAFNRFMQGYRPERDRESIFNALCRSIEGNPDQYLADAERLKGEVSNLSKESFLQTLESIQESPDGALNGILKAIAQNPNYKYSRLFAIGLYTILETIAPDVVGDEKSLNEALNKVASALGFSSDKLTKDLEIYRSNLEKLTQAQTVLNEMIEADRKKRTQREQLQKVGEQDTSVTTSEIQDS